MAKKSSKYKLVSTANDGPAVCAFFALPEGCRNGSNCKFAHTLPRDAGSVVSSESEERKQTSKKRGMSEEALLNFNTAKKNKKSKKSNVVVASNEATTVPVISTFSSMATAQPSINNNSSGSSSNNNNKNAAKTMEHNKIEQDESGIIYFGGKNKAADLSRRQETTHHEDSHKSPAKHHVAAKEEQQRRQETTHRNESHKSPAKHHAVVKEDQQPAKYDNRSLFSKLNLPVAKFDLNKTTTSDKPKQQKQQQQQQQQQHQKVEPAQETSSNGDSSDDDNVEEIETVNDKTTSGLYLPPISTPGAAQWELSITESRKHDRYREVINYKAAMQRFEEQGICPLSGWIKAKSYQSAFSSLPSAIGIDCEMCVTQDPVTGQKDYMALCRFSIVDANTEETLIDTLVKPPWPVVDYRTKINGITEKDLENVQFTLRHAQAFLMEVCHDQTVIIGHSIHSDLEALRMEHYMLADSVLLYQDTEKSGSYCSLKDVIKTLYKRDMPETHDSINDAREAVHCVKYYQEHHGKVPFVKRSMTKREMYQNRLLVHRIPLKWTIFDVQNMFLKHTNVLPYHIDKIEKSDTFGRTFAVFKSEDHAALAFKSFTGDISEDKTGHAQKRYVLREGGHLWIRKIGYDQPTLQERRQSNGPRKSM